MELTKKENPPPIRKKAVFAISQLEPDQSTPALMGLINGFNERLVKKEALFWLGQPDDPLALDYLERVLTSSAN
jgi:HEAT repeat protein